MAPKSLFQFLIPIRLQVLAHTAVKTLSKIIKTGNYLSAMPFLQVWTPCQFLSSLGHSPLCSCSLYIHIYIHTAYALSVICNNLRKGWSNGSYSICQGLWGLIDLSCYPAFPLEHGILAITLIMDYKWLSALRATYFHQFSPIYFHFLSVPRHEKDLKTLSYFLSLYSLTFSPSAK